MKDSKIYFTALQLYVSQRRTEAAEGWRCTERTMGGVLGGPPLKGEPLTVWSSAQAEGTLLDK